MKKLVFLGLTAMFAFAVVLSSCKKDEDELCVTCKDGDVDVQYCYEEGNAIDAAASWAKFIQDHPNATDCGDPK